MDPLLEKVLNGLKAYDGSGVPSVHENYKSLISYLPKLDTCKPGER